MSPKLLHLYGPFELNSFNAFLILGIVVFMRTALKHPGLSSFIAPHEFANISLETALAGLLGGRILHVISDWHQYSSLYEIVSIWNGGMSILGTLIGALSYSMIALPRKTTAPLAVFDVAALYVPLVHALARIGCFFTGCCYGVQTGLPWAVEYEHPLTMAPLHIKIHPTQLYSSALYILLFGLLNYLSTRYTLGTGRFFMIYLIGMGLERFCVDFFRGDRIMVAHPLWRLLSFHQWIALAIVGAALLGLLYCTKKERLGHTSIKL